MPEMLRASISLISRQLYDGLCAETPNYHHSPLHHLLLSPPQQQVCAMETLNYVHVLGGYVMGMARSLPSVLRFGVPDSKFAHACISKKQYRASLAIVLRFQEL